MQAQAYVRNPLFRLVPLAAGCVLLAACGNTTVSVGGGSSGGGSNGVLAGTFTKPATSSRGNDQAPVFGAVDSVGNGFLADLTGTSRAVFVFGSASSSGKLNGSFAAYAANGSNLGNGTTLQQGAVSGTVTTSANVTTANATFKNSASGFQDSANVVLDQPLLARAPLSTVAGQYTVATGSAAIASSSLATSGTYTVTVGSAGSFGITSDAGCNLQNSGSAALDANYNILDIHVNGSCPGTGGITLDGLAVYLPAGAKSPLDGSTLAKPALLVEMSDFISNSGAPNKALVLVAQRAS